ncbi:MAG: DNA damage-inducible protein D [Chitinispirillales bacterium]|jgi:DNA-damage-inducible protein D|nr:DNA damage-inducible protein D [Chitinispirillales bacterium]
MELEKWQSKKFEDIKRIDEYGQEYWLARELQSVLNYAQWRRFCDAIDRAMVSCKLNMQDPKYHFADIDKFIEMPAKLRKNAVNFGFAGVGKTKTKKIPDYRLTRFACYLIVMNGDPRKEPIAHGQMYFAVKTRQQEILEIYEQLDEGGKRLFLRGDIKQKNMLLYETAKKAGIQTTYDYAKFTDKGYMGLYGGLAARDISDRKGLNENQEILDYMGSEELGANLFRITQTEGRLKKENVTDKDTAGKIHYQIGKEVRGAIERIGGTMPEDLPMPEKSIPELQKEQLKAIKSKKKKYQ